MTQRLKRDELRSLLLDEGVALLLEEGMDLGLGHITFPRIFERVEAATGRRVTAASVYERVWSSQTEFQWDVLSVLIEQADPMDERIWRRVRRILSRADRSSPEARLACLRTLCQVIVERHVIEKSARPHYGVVLAAVAAVTSEGAAGVELEGLQRVRRALADYLEREAAAFDDLYHAIGGALGLRTIAPLDLRQFVLAVGALGEGVALRLNYFPEYARTIKAPGYGFDAAPEMWSLAGFGVGAIVDAMIEIDPDWTLSAEIRNPGDRPPE
jgi:hypothetical protein